jgi:hypothetical protein
MPIFDRFWRSRPGQVSEGEVALEPLLGWLADTSARYVDRAIDPDLLRAQLADHCRDMGLEPLLPEEFDRLVERLDEEAWRRLALLVSALEVAEVCRLVPAVRGGRSLKAVLAEAFVELARATPLLTLSLLRESKFRLEEFTRRFLARLGATIQGETAEQSRQRLQRLDYEQLLAETERSRASAEEHWKRVEERTRRTRRGKW